MSDLLELFLIFIKMGFMTFGGGYSMLPILQRELVERKKWISMAEITDFFAIGQCTPGVIAVNVSTFIGYKRGGIPGAVLATLGFTIPSLLIIIVIASVLSNISDILIVQRAFSGIRVAVAALIVNAVIRMFKGAVRDIKGLILCIAAFVLSAVFKVSPVPIILCAAAGGFLLYRKRKEAS